jgi:hypothetical protein
MELTRKDIMNYHLLEDLIERNAKKLDRYMKNEPCAVVGKVYGSNPVFPYEQRGFTVSGSDPSDQQRWKEWNEKCRYLEISIKADTDRLIELKLAVDELIAGIDDVEDKMILEYTLDGKSQQWIADKVRLDQSVVSRRLRKYLKS